MACKIEPRLGFDQPVFLYDYPVEFGALARAKKTDPAVAERFELYMGGLELANAFSELIDEKEQRLRFEKAQQARRTAGKKIYPCRNPSWSLCSASRIFRHRPWSRPPGHDLHRLRYH